MLTKNQVLKIEAKIVRFKIEAQEKGKVFEKKTLCQNIGISPSSLTLALKMKAHQPNAEAKILDWLENGKFIEN